jgi:hypothetical protein
MPSASKNLGVRLSAKVRKKEDIGHRLQATDVIGKVLEQEAAKVKKVFLSSL